MSRKPQKAKKALPPIKPQEIPYELPESWEWERIVDVISVLSPPEKIPTSQYGREGLYPIIDQSQQAISGYTDNQKALINPKDGIVVFGDHTRIVKLLCEPFAQGADGIKLLMPQSGLFPKYLQYYLKTSPVPDQGYRRHFSLLKQCLIPLPPLEEQKRIAGILKDRFEKLESTRKGLEQVLPGIKAFRESVLRRAMRGELVAQLKADEPASVLLEKIEKEKAGQKKKKALPPIRPEEISHELPENWEWVRLGDVVDILDNLRKPITKRDRVSGEYPYYGATGQLDSVSDYLFDEPLLLLGEDGAKWGAGEKSSYQINGRTWVSNHAHVLRVVAGILLRVYLEQYLNYADLSKYVTGTTVPKLNQGKTLLIPIPLPPLEEQKRIVAKIEQYFAYADALEKHTQQALENLDPLKQAWLKKAFSGKL